MDLPLYVMKINGTLQDPLATAIFFLFFIFLFLKFGSLSLFVSFIVFDFIWTQIIDGWLVIKMVLNKERQMFQLKTTWNILTI